MTVSNWHKFTLLSWKNWLLQWRHKTRSIFELLLPLIATSFLLMYRSISTRDDTVATQYYEPLLSTNVETYNYQFHDQNVTMAFAYSPENEILDKLVRKASMRIQSPYVVDNEELFFVLSNKTSEDLETFLIEKDIYVGIEFPNSYKTLTQVPEKFQFSLRFPYFFRLPRGFNSWNLKSKFSYRTDWYQLSEYYSEGFIAVQSALSQAYIEEKGGKVSEIFIQGYPDEPHVKDTFHDTFKDIISFMIIISLALPAVTLVKFVTLEKFQQLKETLKIIGLPNWLHWTSWFFKGLLQFTIIVTVITILMKIKIPYAFESNKSDCVLPNSNAFLLWILLVIFSATTCCFCFMISTLFSKPNVAVFWFFIVWLLSYFASKINIESTSGKYLISLLSNSGFALAIRMVTKYEYLGIGLQFNNVLKPPAINDDFTVGSVMLMFCVDAVLYMLIACYIEQLKPGDFGVPRPWYFPFMKSYWCRSVKVGSEVAILREGKNFEPNPVGHRAGIEVKNLVKEFGAYTAVNGLSMNMYENQITVLLGHNGAGKTTTLSMLTGMIPPTSGTALIDGKDIRTDIEGVRASFGLCPQHNILFDELTVAEHVRFFAGLKGVAGKDMNNEIETFLRLLEFEDKMNTPSVQLSGGMKRKLSVILALCGNTKIVLLDEPTSGMDPSARRALWDLLIEAKNGRTILLTTQFMDEADVLGDKIAIMSEGALKCLGSPFFLKKRYGVGYRLTCIKDANCDTNKMTQILLKHVPRISIEKQTKTEFYYILDEKNSANFKAIFKDVEEQSKSCGVEGFGVSLTTMEEVFLKVGRDADMQDEQSTGATSTNLESGDTEHSKPVTGCALFLNQIIATILKKFYYNLHCWKIFLLMLTFPIIYLIIMFLSEKIDFFGQPKSLLLTSDLYKGSVSILQTNDIPFVSVYSSVMKDVVHIQTDLQDYLLTEKPKSVISTYIAPNNMTAFFNAEAIHSAPISLNVLYNAMCFRSTIEVTNSPVRKNKPKNNDETYQDNSHDLIIILIVGLIYSIFVSLLIVFYVKEKVSRSKMLQMVFGINTFAYWLPSFLWDFLLFIIFTLIFLITIHLQAEVFWSNADVLILMFVLLIVFAWATLPMIYMASNIFKVPSTGVIVLLFFGLFAGVIPGLALSELMLEGILTKAKWYVPVNAVFVTIPHFALTKGLSNLKFINNLKYPYEMRCKEIPNCNLRNICSSEYFPEYCKIPKTFDWKSPGIGQIVFTLAVVGLFWFVVLFLKEYRIFHCQCSSRKYPSTVSDADEDVAAEHDRVHSLNNSEIKDFNIVVKDATKWYKNFLAVKKLCLTVEQGECFGLLGANGAGKTTTFKMLTGEIGISSGDAWIQGINLKSRNNKISKCMSYCPQFDALLENLTGRETLCIFCLIRGIHWHDISRITHELSEQLHFTKHLDKPTCALSGGNKRKLSTALALLNKPAVIFLDEPTSGLDPGAKRKLWDMVSKVRATGCSIVLTSHSMEECEALCTRLAIMVNGQFKCIGSTQHLKNKFSKGYLLSIKMMKDLDENETQRIKDFIGTSFKGAKLKEQHMEMLNYNLDSTNLRWSEMFGIMEAKKTELKIEDYSLGQNSLEQVFLHFTKYQSGVPT